MDDFEKFMNAPTETIPATDENILAEYHKRLDVGSVAKVFCIRRTEVNAVLKRTGIIIQRNNKAKS